MKTRDARAGLLQVGFSETEIEAVMFQLWPFEIDVDMSSFPFR
jgi:hypothetical protein